MSRYTHIFGGQESKTIANLPDLSFTGRQSQIATGTDGKLQEQIDGAYKKLTKKSDFCRNQKDLNVTSWQSETVNKCLNPDVSKSLKSSMLDTKKEPMSSTDPPQKAPRPPRLEHGTYGLEIRCSIQLSYGRIRLKCLKCNESLYALSISFTPETAVVPKWVCFLSVLSFDNLMFIDKFRVNFNT